MIFTQALVALQKQFQSEFDLSSTIRHRGERGRQREHGLACFLRDILPAAYGVATGEVLPHKGAAASPQCDIIIYDRLRFPVLGVGKAVQQVPLEAVYAVIECKSVIDAGALKDARKKFDAIRAMPRVPSETKRKKGMMAGPDFYLFGYKLRSTPDACKQFTIDASNSGDVVVCALNKGFTVWIAQPKGDRCVWLTATDESSGTYETLAMFYGILLEGLRRIDLGSPDYMKMFMNWK